MFEHARREAPDEACGLLAGRGRGDEATVERVVPVRNAHPRPLKEYAIDPGDLARETMRVEDEWGLEVVGFYHSHPRGPPHPSATDAARAAWEGTLYALAWLAPADGFGCWRWDGAAGFAPVEVVVASGGEVPRGAGVGEAGPR